MDPSNNFETASSSSSEFSTEHDEFTIGTGQQTAKSEESDEILAKTESMAILRLRLLVILVLLLAAAAVSTVAYLITSNGEEQEFLTQYTGAALKVIEAFEGIILNKLGGVSALAVTVEAYGIDYGNKWPFITISSFQERAAPARSQSRALFLKTCPLVTNENRDKWEAYAIEDDGGWIEAGLAYQRKRVTTLFSNTSVSGVLPQNASEVLDTGTIQLMLDLQGDLVPEGEQGIYLPIWQTSPVVRNEVNVDALRKPGVTDGALKCLQSQKAVVGRYFQAPAGGMDSSDAVTRFLATLLSLDANKPVEYRGDPMSRVFLPVFNSFQEPKKLVALLIAQVHWASYFSKILPSTTKGITAVISNPCDGSHTFEINGETVIYLGVGDLHDKKFSSLERNSTFAAFDTIADGTEQGLPLYHDECTHSIRVYPSQEFSDYYHTNTPLIVTIAVAAIFIFTVSMFLVYDRLVERRQRLVMSSAAKSSAIVASLFPKNVRERLMQEQETERTSSNGEYMPPRSRLKSLIGGSDVEKPEDKQKPIADLFPDATVLFADIAGFTAWSSTREPAHVFVLLQTVYQVFDTIAKRRGVFKVETIGDSYVAVTGCPEPQANHAIIMAKFAADCMEKMNTITQELEVTLGPGTGDLAMRFGLHSGPVTAGVLRGERSRFQLFGDTVNTAARMESTGMKKKIQASQATADLLIAAGKSHWVTPRTDAVEAKGKGVLNTYWVQTTTKNGHSRSSSETNSLTPDSLLESNAVDSDFAAQHMNVVGDLAKHDRLIDWITELLKDYIKPILERQHHAHYMPRRVSQRNVRRISDSSALDEMVEVICLPDFDHDEWTTTLATSEQEITINEEICLQLRRYIAIVASMYRDNPFHNFEHACHVTMSVHKFIQRILTPDLNPLEGNQSIESQLHDYTHGMRSDRLTLFAIVFSALIHDIDHRGISNSQLMVEEKQMAQMYRNTSIAEQNSLTLAWNLLMSEGFEALRSALFATESDLKRFRQVCVNVVLATDIFDKELNRIRKTRWDKAFSSLEDTETRADRNNLKATIVMEHIMQASDVSHTMQHWHIYRKWNSRLFHEMARAYQEGRMDKDPATFWYEGELDFFDNYVIPLAKKLKECNVLGVSSDECLAYARKNRAEWEEYGQSIVDAMKLECVVQGRI